MGPHDQVPCASPAVNPRARQPPLPGLPQKDAGPVAVLLVRSREAALPTAPLAAPTRPAKEGRCLIDRQDHARATAVVHGAGLEADHLERRARPVTIDPAEPNPKTHDGAPNASDWQVAAVPSLAPPLQAQTRSSPVAAMREHGTSAPQDDFPCCVSHQVRAVWCPTGLESRGYYTS